MRRVAQLVVFVAAGISAFLCLWILWWIVIVSSGGAVSECDRGDCGALGNWAYENFTLVAALFAGAAVAIAGLVVKRLFPIPMTDSGQAH